MDEIDKLIKGTRNNERKRIALKLIVRANHFLKNITDVDSPMILVATELKIQADEIYSQFD